MTKKACPSHHAMPLSPHENEKGQQNNMNHQSEGGLPPKHTPGKTQPKKHHNSRENDTAKRTTRKKTTNSRELALGLLWNNSGNPGNMPCLSRGDRRIEESIEKPGTRNPNEPRWPATTQMGEVLLIGTGILLGMFYNNQFSLWSCI
jgi:hypothetical protein